MPKLKTKSGKRDRASAMFGRPAEAAASESVPP